jgi:hypothetical protein
MYCGSCCPKGSAPIYRSKITPGLQDELDRQSHAQSGAVEDTLFTSSILSAIVRLFMGDGD